MNIIPEFDVIAIAEYYPLDLIEKINQYCRSHSKGFLSVGVQGLFGHVFTDFGEHHFVNDPNGEPKIMALITGIT